MAKMRVFLADSQTAERKALRTLLKGLKMDVVGEAADWPTTLAKAPQTSMEMLLVEWSMLPPDSGEQALQQLRLACPGAIVVVLISQLDAREQAARSAGADLFISKRETPERVADRLRLYAGNLNNKVELSSKRAG